MTKNGEDLFAQKKFEDHRESRPTQEQIEIALLEQQLQHAQNTIEHLHDCIDRPIKKRLTYSENDIDQLFEQRNQIEVECKKLQLDQQCEVEFSKRVLQIMGWRL